MPMSCIRFSAPDFAPCSVWVASLIVARCSAIVLQYRLIAESFAVSMSGCCLGRFAIGPILCRLWSEQPAVRAASVLSQQQRVGVRVRDLEVRSLQLGQHDLRAQLVRVLVLAADLFASLLRGAH